MLSLPSLSRLAALRAQVARLERPSAASSSDAGPAPSAAALRFGVPPIDRHLPAGGLARGALHEVAGAGTELEHGAAAALLIAGLLARAPGPVLWVLERADLFAPGLAAVGLAPGRVIYAEAGRVEAVLASLEEGLRHPGLLAGVAEVSGRLSLAATRRLHLAAEASGVTGFVLRRAWRGAAEATAGPGEPSAALTRWRVGALPSPPPFADAPDVPGLGRARWQLDLWRARGVAPASFVVEACDAKGRLRLVTVLADGSVAAEPDGSAGSGAGEPSRRAAG
ncbi:MAG: damage-inducible protein [Rhodospirillales bacterium]|nr:damage-inducible protein [Rhodospirillales bacterium]